MKHEIKKGSNFLFRSGKSKDLPLTSQKIDVFLTYLVIMHIILSNFPETLFINISVMFHLWLLCGLTKKRDIIRIK